MNHWHKTVMKWECHLGLETDIPVTDWRDPAKKLVHTIHELTATSLPDREVKVEVGVRRVCISPTTERETILARLSEGMERFRKTRTGLECQRICVHDGGQFSAVFTIEFRLENGEKFCDVAIEAVREIFKSLGVQDDDGYYLADFEHSRETFIRLDDAWIPFARWLRMTHRLPIWCTADIRSQARCG